MLDETRPLLVVLLATDSGPVSFILYFIIFVHTASSQRTDLGRGGVRTVGGR